MIWDLDHYRAILYLDDKDLKQMKCLVAPTKVPDTLKVKEVFDKLNTLRISINLIEKTARSERLITLSSLGKIRNFELFRSCDGSNINQSGIILTVEGMKKTAILTGGHHYSQIYNDVLSYINDNRPYELVVPHHGGHAGNFDRSKWRHINLSSGAMSTEKGRY